MMTAPVLGIFWSHRFLFLFVAFVMFAALAAVIFMLPAPARTTIRLAIEIGSVAVGDKPEPFESPESIARQISNVHGPAALLALAKTGTMPSILRVLQSPSVESIGRSVVMVSTIDSSLEKEAMEFQRTTADLVAKQLEPRAQALRARIATRLALAARATNSLEQQIRDDTSEIKRIDTLIDDLSRQLETQRTRLVTLYHRTGTELQLGESEKLEVQIRELQEQITNQTKLMDNLVRERFSFVRSIPMTRSLLDAQARALADAQFESGSFRETQILMPSASMPTNESARQQRSLLFAAFTVSLLAGFGAIVMSHNMGARRG